MSKSKTTTKEAIKQGAELKALKKSIISGHEAVEGLVKSAKDKSRQALAEAILVGKHLARAKTILGFGSFTRWCKQEFPKLGERTVQRYMALYNSFGGKASHVTELPATSLRKAYIALGIIKEDEVEQAKPADEPGTLSAPHATPPTTTATAKVAVTTAAAAPAKAATASASSLSAKLKIEQPKPAISKADVLSRPKYLVKELLLDLQNIIQTNSVPLHELEAAVLQPLQDAFNAAKTTGKKGR